MNKRNAAGAAILASIFIASFCFAGGIAVIWNLAAFIIVFSGLFTALLLSYPFESIRNAFSVAKNSYATKPAEPADIVHTLLDLAVRSKVDGVLALEKISERTTLSFLKNGLELLVDNYKEEEIRDHLGTEMAYFNLRRMQSERIFHTLAKSAPAFGVAGSVIGLIGLLMGVGDTGAILTHIPVAFVSTLYGIVLANMVFAPMAESIHTRTREELLNKKMIMDGIIAIHKEQNPYKLEKKLTSFLSPSEREGKTEALRVITRRYVQKKKREESGEEGEQLMPDITLIKAS